MQEFYIAVDFNEKKILYYYSSSFRNSWTVKDRALPEIPDCGSSTQSLPENGIHINNVKVISEPVKCKSHNKAMAPKPPGSDPSKVVSLFSIFVKFLTCNSELN